MEGRLSPEYDRLGKKRRDGGRFITMLIVIHIFNINSYTMKKKSFMAAGVTWCVAFHTRQLVQTTRKTINEIMCSRSVLTHC